VALGLFIGQHGGISWPAKLAVCFLLVACLVYSSTLQMKAVSSFETLVNICQSKLLFVVGIINRVAKQHNTQTGLYFIFVMMNRILESCNI
jgi:hypothetical protein